MVPSQNTEIATKWWKGKGKCSKEKITFPFAPFPRILSMVPSQNTEIATSLKMVER